MNLVSHRVWSKNLKVRVYGKQRSCSYSKDVVEVGVTEVVGEAADRFC